MEVVCNLADCRPGFRDRLRGTGFRLIKNRSFVREPDYKNSPKYCLLVLGQDAKHRIWLIGDGDVLYVDVNGDGDLTEANERFDDRYPKIPHLLSQQSGYTNLRISWYGDTARIRLESKRLGLQYVGAMKADRPTFASSREKAPVIHFDGPITIGQYSSELEISRTNPPERFRSKSLRVMVGTPGVGKGTFAAMHCKCLRSKGYMTAKFQFESREEEGTPLEISAQLKKSG